MEQTIKEQIHAVEIFGGCAKAQSLGQHAPADLKSSVSVISIQ